MRKSYFGTVIYMQVKSLVKNPGFWLLLIWAALFLWQPLALGFYHDDWATIVEAGHQGGPFSAARWHFSWQSYQTRPVNVPILYLSSSLLGTSPLIWQLFLAALSLAAAAVFYRLLRSLFSLLDLTSNPGILIASIFWLLQPFATALQAWPMTVAINLSLIFFGLSMTGYLNSWHQEKSLTLLPPLLLLLSYLGYEAFYFQFWPFLIWGGWAAWHKRTSWKPIITGAASLILVQLVAVIMANWLNRSGGAGFRQITDQFVGLFRHSLIRLPALLHQSTREVAIIILLLGFGILSIVWIKRKSISREQLNLYALALILCLGGVVTSIGVFALGGYCLQAIGIFSRTMIGVAFWSTILTAFLASLIFSMPQPSRKICLVLGLAILICLAAANISRKMEWAKVWQIEQTIIGQAPLEKIKPLPVEAVVVFAGPADYQGVAVFGAFWDITGAINNSYPQIRKNGRDIRFTVKREWFCQYDGQILKQSWSPHGEKPVWQMPASEVWLWDYSSGRFSKMEPPVEF